ncbi:MAG: ribonuclease PH [Omnitrophica WOR_2 bacterium GWA2_47_8]|nr:MAG: ribonuclease PH [Omnitrophica WOR_2 bacterium GWA2_47_8]
MFKPKERTTDQIRPVKVTKNFIKHAEGSCLIEFGDTRVVCTATVENEVPPFLQNTGSGWVTAEYGMLPRSCVTRVKRDKSSGRTQEIQRLVGRALRIVVDLERLGPRTIKIDCDVLQADGGTRTASITGGFIAMADALIKLKKEGVIKEIPIKDYVAAVSVGLLDNTLILDLNYEEDSNAEVDMNVVMVGAGEFVEIQGTGERGTFDKNTADQLLDLASQGIQKLIQIQRENLRELDI